ncbi:MAG: DNA repair protein RecN [Clostridia bacterium]|nr:DNA repair protein RecN [Clostridia bacterium]
MLAQLKIENIAIIENARITLSDGFNVLTGETGAGKSIIIDSINAILGERTSKELIRNGASEANVTAVFTDCGDRVTELLKEYDIDCDSEVIVKRRISADGRSTCRVNGEPVSVSMLKSIGNLLVNIHGQHDSQALFNADNHLRYIDIMADNGDLLERYSEIFRKLNAIKRELQELQTDEAEKMQKLDMLNYRIEELSAADIKIGERDELNKKLSLYRNIENVMNSLQGAYAALSGDEESVGAAGLLSAAAGCLDDVSDTNERLSELTELINTAAIEMREYAFEIREQAESLDADPKEMERAQERLDLLYRLSKKYGDTEEQMIEYLQKAQEEKDRITSSEEREAQLLQELQEYKKAALSTATELRERRIKVSEVFSQKVCEELKALDMPNVRFTVEASETPLSQTGFDKMEFLVSANAGETPKPIIKIASGGELSRIMLAVKNVLSENDDVSTLIFDEIDSGVSGRAAQKIGMKLSEVSKSHQVICVTHLSQIAAYADVHLLIEKSVINGNTYTAVTQLDFEGRKHEIARINAGSDITELQLKNAEEILLKARGGNG